MTKTEGENTMRLNRVVFDDEPLPGQIEIGVIAHEQKNTDSRADCMDDRDKYINNFGCADKKPRKRKIQVDS